MKRGKFITIEGIEGAGKSTALEFIRDYLQKAKLDPVMTREPGGTRLAEAIRSILLHPKEDEPMLPQTELLLMFAGRAQHIRHCIQPALDAGRWVVSDRYVDASYAYQGGGRGIDQEYIQALDQFIVGNLYPDLTLLLDLPPTIGFERAEKRGTQKDRIEQEKMDFFVRVREVYLDRAKRDPMRIKIIDATQSLDQVQQQIAEALDAFMKVV